MNFCCNCDRGIQGLPITLEEKQADGSFDAKEFCCTECLQKYRLKGVQSQKLQQSSNNSNNSSNGGSTHDKLENKPPQSFGPSKPKAIATDVSSPKEAAAKVVPNPVEKVKKSTTPKNAPIPRNSTPRHHYEMFGYFNWELYLKEEGGVPAPLECFNQSAEPPVNEFKLSMKIEAQDPRNPTSTCIATIVGIMGPRLQLRLDGSDSSNDFWELIDSAMIKPIGYCEKNGGMLQPPLGFRKNPSHWQAFVLNTLNGAEIAPAHMFRKEPKGASQNLFEVGMKLEAVDRKNPRLICPATVGYVKEDIIFVTFDGWKGAFDYWVRHDSRNLFPVGWCQQSGHPLQPPGNKVTNEKKKSSATGMIYPSSSQVPISVQILPRSASNGTKISTPSTPITSSATSAASTTPSTTPSTSKLMPSNVSSNAPDDVPDAGKKKTLDKKVIVKEKINGNEVDRSKSCPTINPMKEFQGDRVTSSELQSSNPNSSKKNSPQVTIFINHKCNCGPYLDPELVAKFPKYFGPGSMNKIMKDFVQTIIDSSKDVETVFSQLREGNGNVTVTANFNGKLHERRLPHLSRTGSFWSRLQLVIGVIKCCPNMILNAEISKETCSLCRVKTLQAGSQNSIISVNSEPPRKFINSPRTTLVSHGHKMNDTPKRKLSDIATLTARVPFEERDEDSYKKKPVIIDRPAIIDTRPQTGNGINGVLPHNPMDWNIENVIRHLMSIDQSLIIHAETFRKHEIDGKAFLLLNSDMMMKYMGLKLGPALKICNIIDRLKGNKKIANH